MLSIVNKTHKKYVQAIFNAIKTEVQGKKMMQHSIEKLNQLMEEGNGCIYIKNGKFAGFFGLEFVGENKYIELCALIVVPEFRRRGIADKLFVAVKKLAKQKAIHQKIIILGNDISTKMSLKNGFKKIGKNSLDDILWAPCPKNCQEFPDFPNCHCQTLILQ